MNAPASPGVSAVTPPDELPPGLRADPLAILQNVLQALPGLVHSAVTDALRSTPHSGLTCAVCFMTQAQWEARHMPALKTANQAAVAAAGIAEGDPAAASVNTAAFLPPDLRAGGKDAPPHQFAATVIIDGTGYCPPHVPGNPAMVAAGSSRLIAVPGMSVHLAAQLARGGQPGAVA